MPAARPAIPAGTTSAGPATTRAASAGRRPGWGCGPAWASAASARGADRPQVLRSPCGGAPAWTYGLTRGGVGGGRLMGAAAGEEIRTSTGAAGRHSGGDPALRSGRTDRSGWWASVPHRACGRRRRTTQRTDVGGGRPSLPKVEGLGQLRVKGRPTGVATALAQAGTSPAYLLTRAIRFHEVAESADLGQTGLLFVDHPDPSSSSQPGSSTRHLPSSRFTTTTMCDRLRTAVADSGISMPSTEVDTERVVAWLATSRFCAELDAEAVQGHRRPSTGATIHGR